MAEQKILRCGPAGWSYPHWDSVVYPRPKPRAFHPLEYLSRYFDTIEINTSFYGIPRQEVTRVWLSKVSGNPEFQFTAKLHRQFTHERCLDRDAVASFHRGLRPLLEAGKLGCLLMQFPWSFRFTEENRDFFIRLRRAFSAFPLAAEMRHGSWMREEALGLFIDYHVAFCNIDQPQRTSTMPPTGCLTSSIGYARLHGRGYGRWFQEFDQPRRRGRRPDYLYSPEELAGWKARIDSVRQFADRVYVITANDGAGHSVVNALQLQSMFGLGSNRAPASLARTYRKQLNAYRPDTPLQNSLFPVEAAAQRQLGRAVA